MGALNLNYKSLMVKFLEYVKHNEEKSYANQLISSLKKSKYVCIFGMGQVGSCVASLFQEYDLDVKIDFFCDNDPQKWGKKFCNGIKCISPENLKEYRDDIAIIIATQHHEEIREQLAEVGFNNFFPIVAYLSLRNILFCRDNRAYLEEKLLEVMDILADEESKRVLLSIVKKWYADSPLQVDYGDIYTENQYFADGIIKLTDNEVLVDAGAFDGVTVLDFLRETGADFKGIYSFELDRNNYKLLEKTIENLEAHIRNKINIHNIGLWNVKKEIRFNTLDQGSNIADQGDTVGNVDYIDNLLKGKKVTYIKMDIEGAELKALSGGEAIIKTQKPKLGICVYHSPSDICEIPLYIKKIVPEYKIYLRHHTITECETVCYAVI